MRSSMPIWRSSRRWSCLPAFWVAAAQLTRPWDGPSWRGEVRHARVFPRDIATANSAEKILDNILKSLVLLRLRFIKKLRPRESVTKGVTTPGITRTPGIDTFLCYCTCLSSCSRFPDSGFTCSTQLLATHLKLLDNRRL